MAHPLDEPGLKLVALDRELLTVRVIDGERFFPDGRCPEMLKIEGEPEPLFRLAGIVRDGTHEDPELRAAYYVTDRASGEPTWHEVVEVAAGAPRCSLRHLTALFCEAWLHRDQLPDATE